MNFKHVPVSSELSIPVPDNLTPEDAANYIANQIAFVDLEQLAAEMYSAMKLWEEGKMIPMEDLLEELARDETDNGTNT